MQTPTPSALDRSICPKCTYPHVHSAQEAMNHLARKLPDYSILDINQCKEKVLLRDSQGELVVFSYNLRISSQLKDNRFDYHIHGNITAHERLMKELFNTIPTAPERTKTSKLTIRTNSDRAESAYRAVQKFSDTTGLDGEEMFTKISDLLCNLRHLADEQGVDYNDCQEQADRHYESEIAQ
ncbi:hypothetical protein ACP3V3_01925 [Vibrio sp. PNB22_3_1]